MAHANEEFIARGFRGMCSGDVQVFQEMLDGDAVLHYPGRSPLAGTHQGHDEITAWVRRGAELRGGKWHVALTGTFADDHRGVALYVSSRESAGKTVYERYTAVMTIRGGKVSQLWVMPEDLYAADEQLTGQATP